jgi:hypothetical protein
MCMSNLFLIKGYRMEINSYVSLLAQYDSACRSGFDLQGCDYGQ